MKLKTVALALTSACMLGAASSQAAVVSYLDTYDQLGTKMGQDGLFFVRNAGSSAHGDPSVKRGWALYAWDTLGRGWKMLNKQDLMDLGSIDFNELLTKKMYSTDIGPFKTKVNTFGEQISQCVLGLAELKADDIIIKGQIETLDAKIGSYNGPITNLTDRVVTLENGQAVLVASVDELSAGVAALKGRVTFVEGQVTSLSNAVVAVDGKIPLAMVETKTYTDVAVLDLKIDMITNTAKRVNAAIETAKTYTDGQIDIEKTRADQSAQSKVDAKAAETLSAAKAYSDEQLAPVVSKANVTESNLATLETTVTANKTDADAKFVALGGKVDANKIAIDNALIGTNADLIAKIDADVAGAKSEAASALATARTEITTEIGTATTAAKTEIQGTINSLSDEVYSDMAKRDAAVSNNVIKIASDDATAKAGAAKEEAVALSAYAWDETSPIASKAIAGITYNNVYVLKNKTQLTATSSATAITIQVPSKDGVIGVQRACSMYLNYTGTTKPTIAIVGETGQTILTGESGSYDYSNIEAGKWLIYVLEVDKNVFWIQTERFSN